MAEHPYVDDGSGQSCEHCGMPEKHYGFHPKPVEERVDRGKRPPPIVRTDDPGTAHEAAQRYQPKRDSAKGRVLAYLQQRIGQWVDAPELVTPEVGGFAGTRRMRELRDVGWPIETRPKPDGSNTWQHRLLPETGLSAGTLDVSVSTDGTET